MKVLKNKILVRVVEKEKRFVAGLEIPQDPDGTENAVVLSLGSEIRDYYDLRTIHEGSNLIMHKGGGSEFTNPEDNQKYRVITESEVIVVLD